MVLGTVLVFIGYRSGKLLVSKRVGYLTGIFIITAIYLIELIAGMQALGHNDFSFLVYISLSIWSFTEYYYSGKKKWIYLIGIFSGMAILCKWVVGLLIYFGWIIFKIQQKKFKVKDAKDLITALVITLIVALPWQVYTFIAFPEDALKAYNYNLLHLTTPLEGHRGNFWYDFDQFKTIYGNLASFLIIPAFFALYKNIRDKKLFYPLLSMVLIVYLFFSLTATKMPSFPTVVSMIILIAFASLFDYILAFVKKIFNNAVVYKMIVFIAIVAIVILRFNVRFLQDRHTLRDKNNSYTRMLSHNKKIFLALKLPGNSVLFNVKGRHYVEAMFYTAFPSYNFIPSKEQYLDLKEKGRTIAVFNPVGKELPGYLKNDSSVIIINEKLEGYN